MKILKQLTGIVLLAFLASWFIGFIEINGATFDIKEAGVTTYWDYDDEDREAFPIVPNRSRQCYEDGFVGLKPNFNQMLNDYVSGENILGLTGTFNNGQTIESKGTDFDICIYPQNLIVEKSSIKLFKNQYKLTDKNSFEIEYHRPNYAKNSYFQGHSYELDIEVEVNGLYSDRYIDFKLKEIYLYYTLDALREHVNAEKEFLKNEYLDTLNNILFIKDNYKIAKEDFLRLKPESISEMNFLSPSSSELYLKEDETLKHVLMAASK